MEKERGERKKKITNTKKFMEFYLVVLHSVLRSEARQWIVARQVSYYNPLSCFNPVTNLTLYLFLNILESYSFFFVILTSIRRAAHIHLYRRFYSVRINLSVNLPYPHTLPYTNSISCADYYYC